MTGYETLMRNILARQQATPRIADDIRRAHRTAIPKASGTVIHIIDGIDKPQEGKPCGARVMSPSIVIYARDDAGVSVTDAACKAVNDRMQDAWPNGVTCKPGRILREAAIADGDAARVTMEFELEYGTAGEYVLELAS